VFSCSKRDRHLSSNEQSPKASPAKTADHVSLSSHLQLSNNRRFKTQKAKPSKLLETATPQETKPKLGPNQHAPINQ
jgi:hypothetical protein